MNAEPEEEEKPLALKVPTSPSFLKPKAISFRKKSSQTKSYVSLTEVDLNKDLKCGYLLKSPKTACNPFRRNANKRKRIDIEDEDSLLSRHVNKTTKDQNIKLKTLPDPIVPALLDECALCSFSDVISPTKSEIEKAPIKILPVDWSLKTKIRFTSPLPFPNKGSFRTFEEVNGTIGFVRCLHSGKADKSDMNSSHGAKVFQHSLVWMFPHLPWLTLFPRYDSCSTSNPYPFITPTMQEAMHSKWCKSFCSLYQQVRMYQCPYFYMCAPKFTVLFRCAGAASIPVLHALISPTTKGFRQALQEEGITFTMPLCENKDLSDDTMDEESTHWNPLNEEEEEKLEEVIEEEETETWLENLGLSQDALPSISKKKRRSDPTYQIDRKSKSLVYVEDLETQALLNFLLNSSFCTLKIGPMVGIPPTLLAPTAFLEGTLQSLQIRHGRIKRGSEELYSMEVSGPLLPNAIHSLCSLFGNTQENGFSAVLSSYHPTTPFSLVNPLSPTVPCIFAQNNMADCGLPQQFLQEMCSKSENTPLKMITFKNGLFTCS